MRRRASVVRPNAAIIVDYRKRLQASNVQLKKIVDRRIKTTLAEIRTLDRSKPGAFQRQVAKLEKRIDGMRRNLGAANNRSEKALDRFVKRMDQENLRRNINAFKGLSSEDTVREQLLAVQEKVSAKSASIQATYAGRVRDANADYIRRVQLLLQEALVNPRLNVRKQINKQKSILTRRIKNMAKNQAHELNAALNQIRQRALGAKRYLWRSQRDDRVRESHEDVDRAGLKHLWSRRPVLSDGTRFHPGEAANCRCWAIPVIETGKRGARA